MESQNSRNSNITISASKESIQSCYNQIWNLQNLIANAKLNESNNLNECNNSELETLNEIVNIKFQIDEKLHEIKQNLPVIKKKLVTRQKKRDKRRIRKNEQYCKNQQRWKDIHEKIDEQLNKIRNKSIQEEKYLDFEKAKQYEINRIESMIKECSNKLALIANLAILRYQRKSQVSFDIDEDDDHQFQQQSTQMSDMLKNHISNLNRRLRSLNNNYEELELKQEIEERNKRLFGDPHFNPNPLLRMSVDSLISIRRKWDAFKTKEIDEDGSYIPINWADSSISFDELFDKKNS